MRRKNLLLILALTMIQFGFQGCEKTDTPAYPIIIGEQENDNVVTDIDGNVYRTVVIGQQTWMMDNLRTTRYRDGTLIADSSIEARVCSTGMYYDYGGDISIINQFGRLYNWHAVNDNRGLAPAGWHVPSQAEWDTLIANLGGPSIAGGKLKQSGTGLWVSPNVGGSNESGFTALPSGNWWDPTFTGCCEGCSYTALESLGYSLGYSTWLWTSSPSPWYASESMSFLLEYNSTDIITTSAYDGRGMAVRCVKD